MNLNPETIAVWKEFLLNPKEHDLDFPAIMEILEDNKNAIPKHLVFQRYIEIIKKEVPKVIFYIIFDGIFMQRQAENGDLGYCVSFIKQSKS